MANPRVSFRSSHRLWALLLLISPLLFAILIMLPRLSQPNFGLFDDGRTLVLSKEINQGVWDLSWDSAAGRFRPVYWLYYAFIYRLSGMHPLGYFLANTLILALTAGLLITLTRQIGLSRFQSWSAGMIFVLSGPVIENFYTLSKPEPLQLLAIILAMVLAVQFARIKNHLGKILILAACFISFLLAYLVKETTLVVLPISAAWVCFAWIRSRRSKQSAGIRPRLVVLGTSALAGMVFFIARRLAVPVSLTGGSYSDQYSFTLQRILASAVRWSGWLIRDFAFLAILVLGLLIMWIFSRRPAPVARQPANDTFPHADLILDAIVWMVAWIAVYLPWVFMQEYYALPFSAGASLAGGLILGWLANGFKRRLIGQKVLLKVILSLAALLWLVTLPTNFSNARIQVAVDDANARVLTDLAYHAPQGSTVIVNIQESNEYVEQMALYYLPKVYHRPDITVIPYQSQPLSVGSEYYRSDVILAVPSVENQPLMAVRMGLYESTQKAWNQSLLGQLTPNWKMGSLIHNQFPLIIVDLPRIFCPFIRTRLFCSVPSPLLDQRLFSYGWALYQIEP